MTAQPVTVHRYITESPETIAPDLTLAQARDRMFQLGARHLPVVENGQLVGILSERDVHLAEALDGDLTRLPVRRAMTPKPFTCGPEAYLHAVAAQMAEHKYGSAVIVDREQPGRVLGVFTTTDALRALAELTRRGE